MPYDRQNSQKPHLLAGTGIGLFASLPNNGDFNVQHFL